MKLFGLADCNNFFVSCERAFRPDLQGRPVLVLSNNDGCVVSRSNEVKALGIKMGVPFYQIKDLVDFCHFAVVFGYGKQFHCVAKLTADFEVLDVN